MGAFKLLDDDVSNHRSLAVVPWTVNHDSDHASDGIPELFLFALKVADILPINQPIENKPLHITISMIQRWEEGGRIVKMGNYNGCARRHPNAGAYELTRNI